MKKVILALAVVSVTFAACNGGDSKTDAKTDSTAVKVDSPAVVKVDTAKKMEAPKVDTAKKMEAPKK